MGRWAIMGRSELKRGDRIELHERCCHGPDTHCVLGGFVWAVREDTSPKHPGVVALVYTLKLDDGQDVEYGPDGGELLVPGSCPNARPASTEQAA